MRIPDIGKCSRTRLAITLLAGCILVAACGKDAAVQMDAEPIPGTTVLETTTITTPPAPAVTADQIESYFAVVRQNDVASFLNAWWAAELGAYFDAIRSAPLRPSPAPLRPVLTMRTPPPTPVPTKAVAKTASQLPAPGGFLACIRQRESRNGYTAVNPSSGAAGAYQMLSGTSRTVAGWMGRSDLAGRPASSWTPAEQDQGAAILLAKVGRSPWAGPGC